MYAKLAEPTIAYESKTESVEDTKSVEETSATVTHGDTSNTTGLVASQEDSDNYYPEEYDEEDEEAVFDRIVCTTFDLFTFDRAHPGPVFTRGRLQRVADDVALINSEHAKPATNRTLNSVQYQRTDEQYVTIWKPHPRGNDVTVNSATRIELMPDFRLRFGAEWGRCRDLRFLNPNTPTRLISAPYYIKSFERAQDDVTVDPNLRTRIEHTQELWLKSPSCV
jgi:hypothetical protein